MCLNCTERKSRVDSPPTSDSRFNTYCVWWCCPGLRTSALDGVVQPRAYCDSSDDEDVFLLVRQWMSDSKLAYSPILVMPKALQPTTCEFVRMLNANPGVAKPRIEPERARELEKFADSLENVYGAVYKRGARYLRKLAACTPSTEVPAPLRFVDLGARFANKRITYESPPDAAFVPRQMQAVFRKFDPRVPDID